MQNYYFQYDLTTGMIYPLLSETVPTTQGMGMLGPFPQETASADIVMAYNYPNRYLVQNGQLIEQPYFTLSSNNGTVTATLNNPPSAPPTSCSFSILGQSIAETLTNNVATLTLVIHPAVASQQFSVSVSATGCVQATASAGGAETGISLQAYKDTSGNWHVAPTQKAVLQAYYTSLVPQQEVAANTLAAISLLADIVFNVLATPTVIATLTTNQQNMINDFKANVLPNLPITAANAYPSGGTKEIHYANFETNMPKYAESVTGYNADVAAIPNLV